ncbi:MAG TPA: GDSL-type esterase/lipase family protein [Flavisolibacter sp.]|nr:GDSL-type esterase/lipase family protein [Flavisolibacter sp.]
MKRILTLLLIFFCVEAIAQNAKPPFWQDIQNFRRQDSIQAVPAHPVLFIGSSSFTRWTDVQDYFPGYNILNRGFGGSTLADVLRYEEDVIFKYDPKQIVIYCGENDVASSDTITATTVFNRFQNLYSEIRAVYPNVPVVYISLKPSPSRWYLKEKAIAVNGLIENFLKNENNAQFISVWNDMLGPDGKPIPELFVEDNLHMNAKGYAIWQKKIQPVLIK